MKKLFEDFRESVLVEVPSPSSERDRVWEYQDAIMSEKWDKKFGIDSKKLAEYMFYFYYWVDEGTFGTKDKRKVGERLLQNVDVLKKINPVSKTPNVFYRALSDLKKAPKTGQRVKYSTKNPYTSWTADKPGAQMYCGSGTSEEHGVLLMVNSNKLLNSGKPFLWPAQTKEFKKFLYSVNIQIANPTEWAFKLEKGVEVDKWEYCG